MPHAALLVAGGMLLGRASGFVRELMLAHYLGATAEADLAVFAIAIPDLLTGMLVGGAFGAVLIPEMHRAARQQGEAAAAALALRWTLLVAVVSLLAAAALAIVAPWLVRLMAPGFEGAVLAEGIRLTRIALLAFPLCTLAAVVSAALQARQTVRMSSLGTVVFNAAVIAAIAGWYVPGSVAVVSWGVVAAAAARLLALLFDVRPAGLHRWKSDDLAQPGSAGPSAIGHQPSAIGGSGVFARPGSAGASSFQSGSAGASPSQRGAMFRRYIAALTATGLTVVVPAVSLAFASAATGGVATVNYAIKLVELPKGVFVALLTMVLFPRISALLAAGEEQAGRRLLGQGTRLVLIATLPLACCFAGCGEPFVRLIFGHGRLNVEQLRQLTLLAQIGFASLPAVGLLTLAMSAFFARQNTRIPLLAGIAAIAAHLGLSWMAMERWGLPGLMAALAASSWLHCGLLWAALARREQIALHEFWPAGPMLLTATIAAAAGGACWQFARFVDNAWLQMAATSLLFLAAVALAWRVNRERTPTLGPTA